MIDLHTVLKKLSVRYHENEGITVAPVADATAGIALAKVVLYEIVDPRTTLYLSGGRTPKVLYEELAQEEMIRPGAVGIVDERFGKKFHGNSNEKLIRETGLQRYLEILDIPYYPILQNESREKTAENYDEKVRHLNATFPKSVAILGIGVDGHTSSIAPNRNPSTALTAGRQGSEEKFINPMFHPERSHLLVSEFNDPKSFYGERVGMTFLGLSMMDVLMVLVFGEDKAAAMGAMFNVKEGLRQAQAEQEVPARFFKRPEIAAKTFIITDQNI